MANTFRNSRMIALARNDRGNFGQPEVPVENDTRGYADPGDAAKPKSFGGQTSAADPSPFNLRG